MTVSELKMLLLLGLVALAWYEFLDRPSGRNLRGAIATTLLL